MTDTTAHAAALVQSGITAFRAGNRPRAYELLVQALLQDSRNELGWLWMSVVVTGQAECRYCLERVLEINPQHAAVRHELRGMPVGDTSRSPLCILPEPEPAQSQPMPAQSVVMHQPIPAQSQPPERAANLCTHSGCDRSISRPGHTLCYDHWKASREQQRMTRSPESAAAPPRQPAPSGPALQPKDPAGLLTASQVGERLELSPRRINLLLAELGWVEQHQGGWIATDLGKACGGTQRRHPQTGVPFVIWPERIVEHKALRQALRGETTASSAVPEQPEQGFRRRSPAKHRTTDGHMVRSKSEMLIDNWLYMSGVVHAYERLLPIEEEVYCDFYLPTGKVYIEYWGLKGEPTYNARRRVKQEIYQKYRLNLIELSDEHICNLDDHLPKLLLKFGITVL